MEKLKASIVEKLVSALHELPDDENQDQEREKLLRELAGRVNQPGDTIRHKGRYVVVEEVSAEYDNGEVIIAYRAKAKKGGLPVLFTKVL